MLLLETSSPLYYVISILSQSMTNGITPKSHAHSPWLTTIRESFQELTTLTKGVNLHREI